MGLNNHKKKGIIIKNKIIMAKNILIIEDDEFLAELLSKKLSDEGFTVSKAANGKEGIEKTKELKPDLILLDRLLPDVGGISFDGFKVLSEIKGDSSTSSIPVILLSNLDQQEGIETGVKLGAVDYLIKSQFTSEEI